MQETADLVTFNELIFNEKFHNNHNKTSEMHLGLYKRSMMERSCKSVNLKGFKVKRVLNLVQGSFFD